MTRKSLFYIDLVHLTAYLNEIIAGKAHFERNVSSGIYLSLGNYPALHIEHADL